MDFSQPLLHVLEDSVQLTQLTLHLLFVRDDVILLGRDLRLGQVALAKVGVHGGLVGQVLQPSREVLCKPTAQTQSEVRRLRSRRTKRAKAGIIRKTEHFSAQPPGFILDLTR